MLDVRSTEKLQLESYTHCIRSESERGVAIVEIIMVVSLNVQEVDALGHRAKTRHDVRQ